MSSNMLFPGGGAIAHHVQSFFSRLRSALACGLMALVTVLALVPGSLAYAAPVAVPEFAGWVVDQTGTLDPSTKVQLESRLAELDKSKGAQLAVLIVATTGEDTIEGYAVRAFQQWRLGRQAVDDGILFVVAKDDRKLRIEVGYGLEGAVPDLLAGRIIREQVTPRFKQDDYAGGIVAGVDSLVRLIEGEDLPPPAEGASADDEEAPLFMLIPLALMSLFLPIGTASLFVGIFVAISFGSLVLGIAAAIGSIVLGMVGMALGMRGKGSSARASRRGSALGGLGGTGFGGGFGGGGFGGGGGGFGGGGGGSSGGGGASGSW